MITIDLKQNVNNIAVGEGVYTYQYITYTSNMFSRGIFFLEDIFWNKLYIQNPTN